MKKGENGTTKSEEIIIPIMGPTGAGKSTFINAILGHAEMEVGHGLGSCTKDIKVAKIRHGGRCLVLVDTPGFDDSEKDDLEILKLIANWLREVYTGRLNLGGVIYLHDLSASRFSGTARHNLGLFNKLCGEAATRNVVLGTTRWETVGRKNGEARVQELKTIYWKEMIDKGARVCKAKNNGTSALALIDVLLGLQPLGSDRKGLGSKTQGGVTLGIQTEMVEERRRVPETEAGQLLRLTLRQALALKKEMSDIANIDPPAEEDPELRKTKLEEKQREIDALIAQIEALKISLPRRLMMRLKKVRLFRN